jgi:AcrR family transcriptional regulator
MNPSDIDAPRRKPGRPPRTAQGDGPDTATALLQAAAAEFVEQGFDDTDTNRIARRAGFSPQTFYHHYSDKLDIFIRVYQAWEEAEKSMLDALLTDQAPARQIAERCVASHGSFMTFRRSLRRLAQSEVRVRQARADSRLAQIASIRQQHPSSPEEAKLAALLVQIERLTEALAEGELHDLNLDEGPAYEALAELITGLRAT